VNPKNKATVLSVVVSCSAYIFAVQGQGGVSVRVLDNALGRRWSWISAARTVEKYVTMFGPLDWRGGALPIAFCRLTLGCLVLANAGVGIHTATLATDSPASKEWAEDSLLILDDAKYLAHEDALREVLV
jgi:hypothetical protein